MLVPSNGSMLKKMLQADYAMGEPPCVPIVWPLLSAVLPEKDPNHLRRADCNEWGAADARRHWHINFDGRRDYPGA